MLPTLWFRNRLVVGQQKSIGPTLAKVCREFQPSVVNAVDEQLGDRYFYCDGDAPLLFTENETNTQRIFGVAEPHAPTSRTASTTTSSTASADAVNPQQHGTKVAAALSSRRSGRAKPQVVRLRLSDMRRRTPSDRTARRQPFGKSFDDAVRPASTGSRRVLRRPSLRHRSMPMQANVMRQALAGMLWSKQFYYYDVDNWLEERGSAIRSSPTRKIGAAQRSAGITCTTATSSRCPTSGSIPGTRPGIWRFTSSPLTLVDPDFGKQQLKLMLRERYMHPNGQIPAYEWNFGDVNPPVHAWADHLHLSPGKGANGRGRSPPGSKSCFQKLLLNFTWWVNRKDRSGKNVFEGGFLGLDNIGVFDRSAPLPTGGYLEQADGTAWMAHLLPEHARDRRRAGHAPIPPTTTWPSSSSSIFSGSPRP